MKPTPARLARVLWPEPVDRTCPPLGNHVDPLDELFFIVLTTMTQYGAAHAFDRMKAAFATWDDLLKTDADERLRAAIERCGLVNQKVPQLLGIAHRLQEDFGAVSLEPLRSMSDADAEAYLVSLPRVGKKVARCVLMYSLGRDVLPVDAHVLRVSRRLGVLPSRITWTKAHDAIHEVVPKRYRYRMHVGMVTLGRTTCSAKKPRCTDCQLMQARLCAGM